MLRRTKQEGLPWATIFGLAAAIFGMGVLVPARGDDPCGDAIKEASALASELRRVRGAELESGRFQVVELEPYAPSGRKVEGLAKALLLSYQANGKTFLSHKLVADDDAFSRVTAEVLDGGKRLHWSHHSGGRHCCLCAYELRVDSGTVSLMHRTR